MSDNGGGAQPDHNENYVIYLHLTYSWKGRK